MRLFVALDLPDSTRQRLGMLCGGLMGVRWTPTDSMHLTLRFIGEVQPRHVDEIDSALAGIHAPRLTLNLAGAGVFTQGSHATLWAGVDRNHALEHLRTKIENALQRVGIVSDRRKYHPHVTLARVDGVSDAALGGWMQANNLFRAPSVVLNCFTLFSSYPGQNRPCYVAEADYTFTSL